MERDELRDQILAAPDLILEDRELMAVLVGAERSTQGGKIVDLRGIAMERLEARLDRLEDTHRSVIAAAYENLAGTNQVHRAILRMLDPVDFEEFLHNLATDVAAILRVESIRLVLESPDPSTSSGLEARMADILAVRHEGYIDRYIDGDREGLPWRTVTLRQHGPGPDSPYGPQAQWIGSEALVRLDFGPGRQAGMIAMGAEDPHQFRPAQGTDLLTFFGGVFERQMRRWLS